MIGLGNLRTQDCQHIRRRELLQLGACSALGLSLPQCLAGAVSDALLDYLRRDILKEHHVTACVETVDVVNPDQF